MAPVSCALNDRTTLKACDTMRTTPSELPKKMLSEPEMTDEIFPGYIESESRESCWRVAYLGEERALVVRELDLRDVEELELPL